MKIMVKWVVFCAIALQSSATLAETLRCDIYLNHKKVSTQTMPIDDRAITSEWGREHPESYFSNYYRPTLCQSIGAGSAVTTSDIGGHKITIYNRQKVDENQPIGQVANGHDVTVYSKDPYFPDCQVVCKKTTP